ncbi:hypothetical protein COU15_00455 [Candidatus Kaiserbacteria bacterium CG10_big_fil_rev_8_21_14_0_10_45_20]|uniref:Uncharacterized protein n=1 Tax=Candidatus Kaiserbacteria bacterium CG10_big_fil_rev_8_21_14_0_10_45_20 TaxID=1974607 RepID=A0A2H0UGL6_9BACT|nr:MAG: hypothetical protein COU15_00455 [Candidatus Kaiserbacteria bacterium CG10_big_fil_rev_8_21_14_0_10_45_20]
MTWLIGTQEDFIHSDLPLREQEKTREMLKAYRIKSRQKGVQKETVTGNVCAQRMDVSESALGIASQEEEREENFIPKPEVVKQTIPTHPDVLKQKDFEVFYCVTCSKQASLKRVSFLTGEDMHYCADCFPVD